MPSRCSVPSSRGRGAGCLAGAGGEMTDQASPGEEKSEFQGRHDSRFHPPFWPPFYAPESWLSSVAWCQPFIEAQRSLLVWYRDELERRARDNGFDDRLREALNAFISSWLDTTQLFREQREEALRVQLELGARYVDVMEQ